jgi:hypothetical protein
MERPLLRLGGGALIAGSLLGAVLNALHPRGFDFDDFTESFLRSAAGDPLWVADHLGLGLSTVLIVVGLAVFARTVAGEAGAALAHTARLTVLLGGALGLALVALDGPAAHTAAVAWERASGPEKAVALATATMVVQVALAFLAMVMLILFGAASVLFGLAIVLGQGYPRWLGWGWLVLGVASAAPGVLLATDGTFTAVSYYLFVATSIPLSLWILLVGILLWRRASTAGVSG